MNELSNYIKPQYEDRMKAMLHFVYYKSLRIGENLMPEDVVDIIYHANRAGRYCKLCSNAFFNAWTGKLSLLIDVYERCGFTFPDKFNRKTYFKYF